MDRVKDWENKEVLTHIDLNAEFSNITDNIESGADVTDVVNVAEVIHGATTKSTPVNNDELSLIDTAAENVLKKLTWTNAKATLKTYFDTLYTGSGGLFNIVEDTTPQLGGDLDMNGHNIGGNTETQLDDAVAKKHAANADIDLDATFEATFVKKADTVNVLSDITSTGANIEDAVTKKHTANTDTALGAQTENLNMNTHKIIGVVDPTTNQEVATKKYVDDNLGGGLEWSVISTNTNAVAKHGYLINASGGNITLTLPTTPSVGDMVGICDFYDKGTTNTITIARNTKNIEGIAENLIININGAGFTIVYSDSTRGWEIVTEIGNGGDEVKKMVIANWTIRTSAADNNWRSVCWSPGLSLFCAVAHSGTGNRVMTSPDGITWTIRTSAANEDWMSVCWSPSLSLFCAVAMSGTGNRVMTSPDGITWTIRTSAADNNWLSVCWSPSLSLFCAVATSGTGNRVMTSPDGITWTIRTSAADNNWLSVCWSPGLSLFCAVAHSGTGNRVMTSPDGITWTIRTSAADNDWFSVCWSPGLSLFCAVATSGTGNRVMTSPDGITWTIRTSAADNNWRSVCWSPGLSLFCAVAHSGTGNRVMTSPDGITWTIRTSAADNDWFSVCWSPGLSLFCAIAHSGTGNRVMTSLFYGN